MKGESSMRESLGESPEEEKKKFFSHHPLLSLLCSLCSPRFIHLAHLSRDKKDVQRPLRVMIQGQRAYRRGCNLMRQVRKEGEGGEQGLEVQRLGVIIGRSRWMWSQPLVNHALIPAALWCHTRLLLITVRASLRCQGFFFNISRILNLAAGKGKISVFYFIITIIAEIWDPRVRGAAHISVTDGKHEQSVRSRAGIRVCLCVFQALALLPLRTKMWWKKCVKSTSMKSTTKWYARLQVSIEELRLI